MNQKEKLMEATMLALQGKLEESEKLKMKELEDEIKDAKDTLDNMTKKDRNYYDIRDELSTNIGTLQNLKNKKELTEDNHEDKDIEAKLDKIYDDLLNEILSEFPDAETKERDWSNQGYKHRIDIILPSLDIKEGVSRKVVIDIFYNIPSFPTYSYYIGASAEVVETSSNETSVAGLKANGYEVKNEIPNCKISIEGYAGRELKDKGQNIKDFVKTISKTYFDLRNYNMKRFI